MSLINLVKSFALPASESDFSSLAAHIKISGTNDPARLYNQDGVQAGRGSVLVGADGSINVWVSGLQVYDIDLYNIKTGFTFKEQLIVDPQAKTGGASLTSEQTYMLDTLYAAGLADGTVLPGATGFSTSSNGLQLTVSNLTLDDNSSQTLIQTFIDWGDGSYGSFQDVRDTPATHYYNQGGAYLVTVCAQSRNNSNYKGTPAQKRVSLAESTNLTFTVGKYTDTDIIQVYVNQGNFQSVGSTVDWGDGVVETMVGDDFDLMHTYPDQGTYTFTVTEVGGARIGTSTVDVANADDFGPYPFGPSANFSSNTVIAGTGVVRFWDTSIVDPAPSAWVWDFGDGTTSAEQNPTHTYSGTGVNTVTLSVNGSAPKNVGTVTAITAPSYSGTTVMSDDFSNDHVMNGRIPTVPMVGVFDAWQAPFDTALAINGVYTNGSQDNGGPAYMSQFDGNTGSPVTPPASLANFEFSFQWSNNSLNTTQTGHDIESCNLSSIPEQGQTWNLANLSWNPYSVDLTGLWVFQVQFYNGDFAWITMARPPANEFLDVKIVFKDGVQYLMVGDQIAMMTNDPGEATNLNFISFQLGRVDEDGGTDFIDNVVLKSI